MEPKPKPVSDTGEYWETLFPNGRPPTPTEREKIRDILRRATLTPEQRLSEDMAKAWDKNTSSDGRPPIGGAQDD